MQTFLPYPDFIQSAKVLDKKRCWKQVVEAKQIINILEKDEVHIDWPQIGQFQMKPTAWRNHPAVKMWEGYGHLEVLRHYYNVFLHHCLYTHKINTKLPYLESRWSFVSDGKIVINSIHWQKGVRDTNLPWWLGNYDFHRAMRARLIEKDRDFYLPKFPDDEGFNGGKYLWPEMETKTFKII